MSKNLLLKNARIINEGKDFTGHIYIIQPYIEHIFHENEVIPESITNSSEIVDVKGRIVIPGVIDDQVHFREPGLTHKGDIFSESLAAVAGGITSFMEMPNTNPQTVSQKALEEKFKIGADKSIGNYSFYIGGTNDNVEELKATDIRNVCGIKVFMGSSTGNMLVDNPESLVKIFSSINNIPIAVHCEEESIIQANTKSAIEKFGENIPIEYHPVIRNAEACYTSSRKAVELAKKYNTRLHILHLSTAKEMTLLDNSPLNESKRITAEVCVHHLWFTKDDYKTKGSFIKWNPAIKELSDRDELWDALLNNKIDVIATDHAPHTFEEKQNIYTKCPSGGPLVQHSLPLMIENCKNGKITLTSVVEKMCHNPAICFNVKKRGFIKQGYFADMVVIDLNKKWIVERSNILYKCGWSPFEGQEFSSSVDYTIINGRIVYNNGIINDSLRGMSLEFNR